MSEKEIFLEKEEKLKNAKVTLKKEFFGIDKPIDEIIENFSTWYLFSEFQERPVVINLWGLTGVGKTSLVKRLIELMNCEDIFYRYDFGSKNNEFGFNEFIEKIYESNSNSLVFMYDEINSNRSILPNGRPNNFSTKKIWELLDTGLIDYHNWEFPAEKLKNLVVKLLNIIDAGVEVENGVVVKNIKIHNAEFEDSSSEKCYFIAPNFYDDIIKAVGNDLKIKLKSKLEDLLLSYDTEDMKNFLNILKNNCNTKIQLSFPKSLFFVSGNIDEAYIISDNFSAELDADKINDLSLKVTVPQMKEILKKYFRKEQIARLGNIHIIYPSLDKTSFYNIIDKELTQYSKDLSNKFQMEVDFSYSIDKLVYTEGVSPALGARSILTTIQQIIKSKMNIFFSKIYFESLKIDQLNLSYEKPFLIGSYKKNGTTIYEHKIMLDPPLQKITKNRKDDLQAVVAVHESGHAVLSMVLLKTIPDQVISVSSVSGANGYNTTSYDTDLIAKEDILKIVAMNLGGYYAEEIIFGAEKITTGSRSDIKNATWLLTDFYKKNGFGDLPIRYGLPLFQESEDYHNLNAIEEKIKDTIVEASKLAKTTLLKEKKLLLALSDHLADNNKIVKSQLIQFAKNNMCSKVEFIENKKNIYYRKHLKNKAKNFKKLQKSIPFFVQDLLLN